MRLHIGFMLLFLLFARFFFNHALSPTTNYIYSLDVVPSTGSSLSSFSGAYGLFTVYRSRYDHMCLYLYIHGYTTHNARLTTSLYFFYKVYYLCTISASRFVPTYTHTYTHSPNAHTRSSTLFLIFSFFLACLSFT